MTLRTVRVPEPMEDLFKQAEGVVSEYFGKRRENPDEGTIEIFGERYLLIRGASLSVEFFDVVRDLLGSGRKAEADEFSRNILFDLAHAIGKSDARNFHTKMGLVEPVEKLSAGPVHFAHAGWAFVDISPDSVPGGKDDYVLLYDHPYSFESDAWIRANKKSTFPVCIMNAGYSSGWCEESFGIELVASEILCQARGDDCCRFVMAHPSRIEAQVGKALEAMPDVGRQPGEHQIPDFFARKRLEDELRKAHDELELRVKERTEELRVANKKLALEIEERASVERQLLQAQKLDALGHLAGGIAHDFNNLLTVINGCSEMILGQLDPAGEARELVSEIARAGGRASRLTEQLLVFSRQQIATTEVVDLGEVVTRMSSMLERLIGEDVRLRTVVDATEAFVRCNPGQIEQVILNLVVNARDAVESGGEISVIVDDSQDESGQRVRLRVFDTGAGIDEETLRHLYDPFYSTKNPGEGSGLGLSIVYGIVQQAGGTIDVESEVGEGSCFTLLFPHAEASTTPGHEESPRSAQSEAGRTILLVEDETAVRDLLVRSLTGNGHHVLAANGATEAKALFNAHSDGIDLVLTDVVMPGETGPELVRQLRALRPEIKVIFISGYTHDRIGEMGLSDSGNVFLQKPLRLVEVEECIQGLFE